MHEADENFLLALIAGEGCFGINFYHKDSFTYGFIPRFRFYIGMKGDREILEMYRDKVDLGNIKKYESGIVHWHIDAKRDCLKLCDMIDKMDTSNFENTRKWDAYIKWRDSIRMYDEQGTTAEALKEIVKTSRNMNSNGSSRKRSEDEMLSIIDKNC